MVVPVKLWVVSTKSKSVIHISANEFQIISDKTYLQMKFQIVSDKVNFTEQNIPPESNPGMKLLVMNQL